MEQILTKYTICFGALLDRKEALLKKRYNRRHLKGLEHMLNAQIRKSPHIQNTLIGLGESSHHESDDEDDTTVTEMRLLLRNAEMWRLNPTSVQI